MISRISRRRLLRPLVPLYAAVLRLRRSLAASGRLERRTLDNVVLSVGSLSAGGAGKTPVVLALAAMLQEREYAVDILTRGYRRRGKAVEQVDPAGTAAHFGDEPLLLAQRSAVPVYVGADRYQAGCLAEAARRPGTIVHLLDDGFQHRQLARDLDLVLLTRQDVEDILLPAGNLREPLSALRRADVVLVREDEAESLERFVSVVTRETGPPPLWKIRRTLVFPKFESSALRHTVAFCGIARPQDFFTMLARNHLVPAEKLVFRDHHSYTDRDLDRLIALAKRSHATGFVTTEKDAVKLTAPLRARLESIAPIIVPALNVEFSDQRAALEQLIALVPRLNRRRRER